MASQDPTCCGRHVKTTPPPLMPLALPCCIRTNVHMVDQYLESAGGHDHIRVHVCMCMRRRGETLERPPVSSSSSLNALQKCSRINNTAAAGPAEAEWKRPFANNVSVWVSLSFLHGSAHGTSLLLYTLAVRRGPTRFNPYAPQLFVEMCQGGSSANK
ncbi:hypothetical protein Taro_026320 [Colocasia esculenta]|uniref:Uncharacterized protein n=1 Tax=Colocasia esculenta TaxID=4460 RepID=A0A843VCK4_COLES|nr:hypothetical protein [Colocasia esculenta]